MLENIIILYSLYTFMKLYISVMQIGYINEEKRKDPVLMSAEKYLVAGNYAVANGKLGIVTTFVDYLVFIWWVFAGFAWLSSIVQLDNSLIQAVAFLFGFIIVNYIVGLPFELYQKFKIDEAFGFNKMTVKMYVIDTLKSTLLFLILGGAIFALLSWIIESFEMWWLWGFAAMFTVAVLANVLAPTFMALFNKFSPLEEGELKQRSINLCSKQGLKTMVFL